ncbi:MAG: LytR/AlgR family response regulator transcription factor [Bacteroidia bacterium]
MIKTIIVDDERLAREELKSLLADFKDIKIIDEASNADDALEKIENQKPDLVFLDIQMPGKTGFDLLEDLIDVPYVIFATAYDEYALKAFEVNALDYLVKPIEKERLKGAVEKAIDSIRLKRETDLDDQSSKLSLNDQVFVKDGDSCWFVTLEKIKMFESVGNYVRVHFDENRPLIHKSLNGLSDRLDDNYFFRANRQQIINLNWIDEIQQWFSGGLLVTLKGGEKIELSRRQAAKFRDMKSL